MAEKRLFGIEMSSWISILLVFLAVGVFVYGGKNGWYNDNINVDTGLDNIADLEADLDGVSATTECILDFSDNDICLGDSITGTLVTNPLTNCYIFADKGSGWEAVYEGVSEVNGMWEEDHIIDAVGDFMFVGMCDLNGDGRYLMNDDCITNKEALTIRDCTPTYNDGDIVGSEEGTNNMGEGINEISTPIDLSDFPEMVDGGQYGLKARIQTEWSYLTPETCNNIQSSEGLIFSLYDSDGLAWTRTDTNPTALGVETDCDLNWDGVNEWMFNVEKIMHDFDCQISYDYKVEVLVCDK